MNAHAHPYTRVPFPRLRQLVVDSGRIGSRRHMIHGLPEVDVTRPRQYLRAHQARTGEVLSFTAFLIACLGRALEAHPSVHAYRGWGGRLYLFEEVDVHLAVAAQAGQASHLAHILRAVNRKSVRQLHEEIRGFQAHQRDSREARQMRRLATLPVILRHLLYWVVRQYPPWLKQCIGTVAVSSIGMFGQGGGWGVPMTNHALALTVGGIAEKPGVVDGQIVIREYLDVTLSFDHDLLDGAPAAAFASAFKTLVEQGYGLNEEATITVERHEQEVPV